MSEQEEIAIDTALIMARCLAQTWAEYLAVLESGLDLFLPEQEEEALFI